MINNEQIIMNMTIMNPIEYYNYTYQMNKFYEDTKDEILNILTKNNESLKLFTLLLRVSINNYMHKKC